MSDKMNEYSDLCNKVKTLEADRDRLKAELADRKAELAECKADIERLMKK